MLTNFAKRSSGRLSFGKLSHYPEFLLLIALLGKFYIARYRRLGRRAA